MPENRKKSLLEIETERNAAREAEKEAARKARIDEIIADLAKKEEERQKQREAWDLRDRKNKEKLEKEKKEKEDQKKNEKEEKQKAEEEKHEEEEEEEENEEEDVSLDIRVNDYEDYIFGMYIFYRSTPFDPVRHMFDTVRHKNS